MGQRKVWVKQKESIKNAIMDYMKQPTDKLVSQQWVIPTVQLIQQEDNGDAWTLLVINKHNCKIWNKDRIDTVLEVLLKVQ